MRVYIVCQRPKRLGTARHFAALLGDIQYRVQDLKVGQADISPLARQAVLDKMILGFGDFHADSIASFEVSVNRP